MSLVGRTFTKPDVESFLVNLVKNPTLAGADPCAFWRGVEFLDIQGAGNSQRDMLALFSSALQKQCGFTVAQCGRAEPHAFLYLDDVLFTGNRILKRHHALDKLGRAAISRRSCCNHRLACRRSILRKSRESRKRRRPSARIFRLLGGDR